MADDDLRDRVMKVLLELQEQAREQAAEPPVNAAELAGLEALERKDERARARLGIEETFSDG
jgi:hypothetical protein